MLRNPLPTKKGVRECLGCETLLSREWLPNFCRECLIGEPKMEKIKIEKEAFVLDAVEKNKLIQLLKYCRHRFEFHLDCGIHQMAVEPSFIDYLLKNL